MNAKFKIPFRQVYCESFWQWLKETLRCHVWLRLCPPVLPEIGMLCSMSNASHAACPNDPVRQSAASGPLANKGPEVAFEHNPDGRAVSTEFREELTALLNKHSKENESNTPDFILASYLLTSLWAFDNATKARDKWYGIAPKPGVS